jgi:hypothetical protein
VHPWYMIYLRTNDRATGGKIEGRSDRERRMKT